MKKNNLSHSNYSSNIKKMNLSNEEMKVEKEFNKRLVEILG